VQALGVIRIAGGQKEVQMRGPIIRPMVFGVSIAVGAVGMSAPVFAQA